MNVYEQFKSLRNEVKNAIQSKELFFVNNDQDGNPDMFYRSTFHNAIKENDDFNKYMNNDNEFLTSRIITVFTYLLIKKVGIKNIDRYLLAFYIYTSVEEIFGLNCLEAIQNFKYDEVSLVE